MEKNKIMLYLEEAHCKPITEPFNTMPKEEIKYWDYYAYKNCNLDYGSKCPKPRCIKSILNVKNGECIYFTCGRRKGEIEW